uniref:Uncharacterized protein n=1 Tax=Leptocylindrus danicus TaxID=163516 RepID=A0A7S2KFU5_9STRA
MGRGSFSGGFFKRCKLKKTKDSSSPVVSEEGSSRAAPSIIDWDHEKCRPIYSSFSNTSETQDSSFSLDDTDDGDHTDDMSNSKDGASEDIEVEGDAENKGNDQSSLVSRWDKSKSRRYGGRGGGTITASTVVAAGVPTFLSDDELSLSVSSSPFEGRTSICCSMDGSDNEKENGTGSSESSSSDEEEHYIAKKRRKLMDKPVGSTNSVKNVQNVNEKKVVSRKMFGGKRGQKMLIKSKKKERNSGVS